MALDWKAKAEIHRRDNCICAYCGFNGQDAASYRFLSVDHVVRRADGGADHPENLVTACIHCNRILNCCSAGSIGEKQMIVEARNRDYDAYFLESIAPHLRPVARP